MFSGGGLLPFKLATALAAGFGIFVFPFTNIWSVLYRFSENGPGFSGIVPALSMTVVFLSSACLLGWITQRIGRARARHETQAMAERLEQTAANAAHAPPFVLFLRPFFIDRRTGMRSLTIGLALIGILVPSMEGLVTAAVFLAVWSELTGNRAGDIERQIGAVTRQYGRLIAIGDEQEIETGGVRLNTTDAAWRDLALTLFQHARLIITVPAATAGSIWEIENLFARGYAAKSLFLFPPKVAFPEESDHAGMSVEWDRVVSRMRQIGVAAPSEIEERGVVWAFPDGTSVQETLVRAGKAAGFGGGSGQVRRALRKALEKMPHVEEAADAPNLLNSGKVGVARTAARATGNAGGAVAIAAVALGALTCVSVWPDAMPTASSIAVTRLINSEAISNQQRLNEILQSHSDEEARRITDEMVREDMSEQFMTRFQQGEALHRDVVFWMMENGYLYGNWGIIQREEPAAVNEFKGRLLGEHLTYEDYRQAKNAFDMELVRHVPEAGSADLLAIAEAQREYLSHMQQTGDWARCVAVASGATPERKTGPGTDDYLRRRYGVDQRIIIAGWRGRERPTARAEPSHADMLALQTKVIEGASNHRLQAAIRGELPAAELSDEEKCQLGLVGTQGLLSLPPETAARIFAGQTRGRLPR